MAYAALGAIALLLLGIALFGFLGRGELTAQIATLKQQVADLEEARSAAIAAGKRKLAAQQEEFDQDATLRRERHDAAVQAMRKTLAAREERLATLDRFSHIPGIIERSKGLEAEIASRLAHVVEAERAAQARADDAVLAAHRDVERMKVRSAAREQEARSRSEALVAAAESAAKEIRDAAAREGHLTKQEILAGARADEDLAKSAARTARQQAEELLEAARKEAKEIASRARKEAKDKTQKVEITLANATSYAAEIRAKAEARADEIAGHAHEALRRVDGLAATAEAMQRKIEGHAAAFLVPPEHILDDLADDFGFHKSGERLKLARDRTRIMMRNGEAATCNYPPGSGWKREYAINFVVDAFNGKVDSILSRIKPANHGKLVQEIKDAFALTNSNGDVFKNARIYEEFLDARLEELKWGVAVQRLKEKDRDEQRAIREQIREEERAKKEHERAVKQARREEELINKAIARVRANFEAASAQDQERYEAELTGLSAKLREAEDKNRRAISLARQTKRGYVYVISNIGSFGEDVFKIGLTRRLDPMDRVRELGDASVPFGFDVHAMILSDDAPALEAALHRRFVQSQVNKVNRRKEFFRLSLQEIRGVVDGMNIDARWTMAAEARDYRESLATERQMRDDPAFGRRWAEAEAARAGRDRDEDEDNGEEDSHGEAANERYSYEGAK